MKDTDRQKVLGLSDEPTLILYVFLNPYTQENHDNISTICDTVYVVSFKKSKFYLDVLNHRTLISYQLSNNSISNFKIWDTANLAVIPILLNCYGNRELSFEYLHH
jgi:hypothetical protein